MADLPEQAFDPSDILTQLPVPGRNEGQVARYNPEILKITDLGEYDPTAVIDSLAHMEGRRAIAIDIGGDGGRIRLYEVQSGRPRMWSDVASGSRKDGQGYLDDILEPAAWQAAAAELPVAISYAGEVNAVDKRLVSGANVPILLGGVAEVYSGQLDQHVEHDSVIEDEVRVSRLFGENLRVLDNDAIAGLRYATVEAARRNPAVSAVIYAIGGSGIGGAVWKEGRLYSMEPGHVEVVDELNPYNQQQACGMDGREFTCIERVGGGKAGIEEIWKALTGDELSGKEIAGLALSGNLDAIKLFSTSAELLYNMVEGIAHANEIDLTSPNGAIVFHGGVTKFTKARLQQLLVSNGVQADVFFTEDLEDDNACLGGAAIAALAAA